MAVYPTDVRVEERLKIKIGEAKNIPARSHGSVGLRDTYCTLSLDQEEIFRTSIVDKSLSPLYCQEFQFEVPRKFRFLSIYLYDHERTVNKDKILGKVAVKREDLHKYNGKDHWFPILNVDADSEVQGKVHLEVKLDQYIKGSNSSSYSQRLLVRVLECSDLTIINGACDPYTIISLVHNNKPDSKKTKTRKKTSCPQFEEIFWFELPMRNSNSHKGQPKIINETFGGTELRISVMHDSSFGSVFLGEVKIPLEGIDLINGHNAWYFLQPRGSIKTSKTNLGSLRLKIFYTSDYVFSSQFYDPLRNLLLKSPYVKPITSSAAYILGEVVQNKVDAAQPLVKVFMHDGKIVDLIKALAEWEISKVTDPNTIFRGNTLVSKCMDEFMKLAGMHYLHQTLRSTIELILTERKHCEIDPSKLKEGESLENNLVNLRLYVDRFFRAITNSALACPALMGEVFAALKQLATCYFPSNWEIRYSVISGFVFLRFFAPAILGPKLFELCSEPIDAQVNRTLTLISKTIQSLGNLVSSRSPSQIFKEDYMATLYKGFITEKTIESVRVFLELISSGSEIQPRSYLTPIALKEGVMIKRAQGRKKFGIKNFKRRYFCLTTQEFYYSKSKGDPFLCRLAIDQILAVERLREESFKMKNMFQVIQPQRALYIQANNCVEEKEWIDILTKICQSNRNRLKEYHPAAFINGHWLCCKLSSELAPGCFPVTASVPPDIRVCIDSDREIQRAQSIFLTYIDTLEKLREACEHQSVYTGETLQLSEHGWTCPRSGTTSSGFIIEDTHSIWETLTSIRSCVLRLEQDHKHHIRSMCRQTKYGSEQAPIGDDNYLMMVAQNSKEFLSL